jgi:menaquinol-cytochrome c reductase iron-sulfur subunit
VATEPEKNIVTAEPVTPAGSETAPSGAGEQGSASDTAPRVPRRNLLAWLTVGLGGIATAVVGLPFLGYLFRMEKRKPPWVDLGPVDQFSADETHPVTFVNPLSTEWDGMTANTRVFVRNQGRDDRGNHTFLVLSDNCAHLGCPVEWFPQSGLFMCPCHGGVYYANGEHASGPPPRGMFACVWRVNKGQLEIQAPHFPTVSDPLGGRRAAADAMDGKQARCKEMRHETLG